VGKLLMFPCMQVCAGGDKNFVVINQKGIDPPSLDLLARAGVIYSLLGGYMTQIYFQP
jgi:hypothetical protein